MSTAITIPGRNGHHATLAEAAPPHDDALEAAVLEGLLKQPQLLDEVQAIIDETAFYCEANRLIYRHIAGVCADGGEPDMVRVADSIKSRPADAAKISAYHESGWIAYVASLFQGTHPGNATYYARRVAELAQRRRLQELGIRLQQAAQGPHDIGNAILDAKAVLDEAATATVTAREPQHKPASLVIADHPRLHKPIIEGLLRREETLNIIAAPKMGKSWLSYGLGLSVVRGGYWLGQFPCHPGRVLLIDNELHEPTLANRLRTVADAMGYSADDYGDALSVLSLRGRLMDIHGIGGLLGRFEPGQFDLVILDALYRALPPGVSENDNAAVAAIFNTIDAIAKHLQCAWVNVHHSSKGSQAEKSVTDVGSGAGAQSRAADAHLVLRPHEEDGAVVLDAVVRSFAPVDPVPLRWAFPLWQRDFALDPTLLRGRLTKGEERKLDRDTEGRDKILAFLQEGAKTTRAIRGTLGCGKDRCNRLLDGLEADGLVAWEEIIERGGRGRRYSRKSQEAEPDELEF